MERVKKQGSGERVVKAFIYVALITLAVTIIVPVLSLIHIYREIPRSHDFLRERSSCWHIQNNVQ